MIANKVTLLTELLGFDRRQFIIPIYQRKYKWTSEQCNRLIDDILRAGKAQKEHFTGTVVYQEPSAGSFKKAYLVDGQQRVTTILLMVKALNIISQTKKDVNQDFQYVYDSTLGYLYADKNDVGKGLKLLPSKNDEQIFNMIIQAKSFAEVEKNPLIINNENDALYNNFKTIYNRFKDLIVDESIIRDIIFEGMLLLTIVEMSLSINDDPQAIFESINSLGLKLSNADLIRNYLLMSNEKQKELYEKYWEIIQDKFIGESNMEAFVFNYLMMKRAYVINSNDIYKEYVNYTNEVFENGFVDHEKLLIDLYNIAKIYQPFIKKCASYTTDTNMLMQELRDMAQSTVYPFLMKVFVDKENNIISEDTLDKVINLIIVYLVRRTICGVPTHSLRGFMLNLYNRVFKVEVNKKRYYEAIYAFLVQLESNDKLRDVEDMRVCLKKAEIYKNVKFATYLLYKLENGRYPNIYSEFTIANSPTVEHIMPQTLTTEWEEMLGEEAEEIHKSYLNTIGNLSLSSRSKNSIMSNESFNEKKKILDLASSKFNVLNKDICTFEKFTLEEINDRENYLSKIVCSKFALEEVNLEGIRFEDNIEIVCSTDYEGVFNYSTVIAFKLFGKEKPVDSFSKIIVLVAKILLQMNPEKMRELAINRFNPWNGSEKDCIHYSYGEDDKDQLIGEDIRVYTNYNSIYCIQFTTLLMEEFGIEASQLIVYLKKDTVRVENALPKKEKVKIIRTALDQLSEEGLLIYDPLNMPKSDDWIKFQTTKLNDVFEYNQETKWDGELFLSCCYLEYNLFSNNVFMTLKAMKKTDNYISLLSKNHEFLGIDEYNDSLWWHIQKYTIDFKKVAEASNKIDEMKKQLRLVIEQINELLNKINELSRL